MATAATIAVAAVADASATAAAASVAAAAAAAVAEPATANTQALERWNSSRRSNSKTRKITSAIRRRRTHNKKHNIHKRDQTTGTETTAIAGAMAARSVKKCE